MSTENRIAITSKEQAIEEFRKVVPGADGYTAQLAVNAWDSGIPNFSWGKAEFEFVRAPEQVVMYTGAQIAHLVRQEFGNVDKLSDMVLVFAFVRDLILARRAEMLRAMGSDELAERVADMVEGRPGLTYRNSAREIISLITERIEANRPELTNAVIEAWHVEWLSSQQHAIDLVDFIAHRAAEYRSPAVSELRADNERLKKDREDGCADYLTLRDISDGHEVECHKLRAKLAAELSQSKEYFTELSRVNAENEQLKKELGIAKRDAERLPEYVRGNDELRQRERQLRAENERLKSAWEKHSKVDVEMRRKVNVLEDMPEWVHEFHCEAGPLANRVEFMRLWESAKPQPVDDSDGPLKVPSEEDIQEQEDGVAYGARASVGARWAIKWIKEANGAE